MLLEDVIRLHLPTIYTGYDILSSHAIRITRDADLPPPGRPENLLASIEESLQERGLGTAVQLQYDGDLPADILATLLDELEMQPEDLYEGEGFAAFSDLLQLYAAVDIPRVKGVVGMVDEDVLGAEGAPDIGRALRRRRRGVGGATDP